MNSRYRISLVLFGIFVVALGSPARVRAQIKILAIVENNHAAEGTDIGCSRRGSHPSVFASMELQNGDKLSSKSTTKIVKVACNGAVYTLTAPFQVTFTTKTTTAGSVCYAGYGGSAGQLSVKSNNTQTNTKSGRGRIITHQTQYAIKLTPGRRRVGFCPFLICLFSKPITREWIVFEDEGDFERAGTSLTIKQGEKIVTGDGRAEISQVTRENIEQTAETYASVDVAQARLLPDAQRNAEVPKLLTLHAAVLSDPKNPQKQDDLKAEQNRIGVPQTAAVSVPTPSPIGTATPGPTVGSTPAPAGVPPPSATGVPTPGPTPTPGSNEVPTPRRMPVSTPGPAGPRPEPPDKNPRLDAEQTRLVGLITQGRYKEAIVGFERRLRGPHATSLDAYELAVAYEQLLKQQVRTQSRTHIRHRVRSRPSKTAGNTPTKRRRPNRAYASVPRRKRPAFYARKAIRLNTTDGRLSQKELDDSRRIASGK